MPQIIVITGASGVGKTTLVDNLAEKLTPKDYQFYHFDSIGVPSFEEMVAEYGSTENWQKVKTFEWINRLIQVFDTQTLILEGSTSMAFIQAAFKQHSFENYQIILIDCSTQEINRRLTQERNQPELVNEDMVNWLRHLRKQAKELGVQIWDTSKYSQEDIVELFIQGFVEKN